MGAFIGRTLLVRGRRRVGKSRLLNEFIARSNVPAVFLKFGTQGAPASYEGTLMMVRVAEVEKSKGEAALGGRPRALSPVTVSRARAYIELEGPSVPPSPLTLASQGAHETLTQPHKVTAPPRHRPPAGERGDLDSEVPLRWASPMVVVP